MHIFAKIVTLDSFRVPLVRKLILIRILRVVLEIAACLNFPRNRIKTFIPTICFSSGLVIALAATVLVYPIVLKYRYLSRTLWTNNGMSKRNHTTMKVYRAICINSVYLFYILMIIGNAAWHFAGGRRQTISLVYVEEHYKHLYYYVLVVEMCLLHATVHMALCFTHGIFDVVLVVIEQICRFADCVEETTALHKLRDRNLSLDNHVVNELYQRRVHGELRIFYYEYLKLVRLATILFQSSVPKFGGCLAQLIGMSMIPILVSSSIYFTKFKMMVFLTTILMITSIYISIFFNLGQLYSDQVSRIYDAFDNMHWYLWSTKNRKSYVLLLTRITFVECIQVGFNLPLNRTSLIMYLKILYSLLTFLYQTNIY